MSVHPNINEQDSLNLFILAEQQKEQRPLKNKNYILEQTHDEKSAQSFEPITKKLEEADESTEEQKD